MFEFLEKHLMGPMGKISSLRPVRAIIAAGMASIPFSIVGSMFLVLNIIQSRMLKWYLCFFKSSPNHLETNSLLKIHTEN